MGGQRAGGVGCAVEEYAAAGQGECTVRGKIPASEEFYGIIKDCHLVGGWITRL